MQKIQVRKARLTDSGLWFWYCTVHFTGTHLDSWEDALAWAVWHAENKHRKMEQDEYSV